LLVIGVICLESWVDLLPVSMILKRLGDSSYSIYLSHTFVIPFFVILVFKLDLSLIWYMVCSLAASMLVGFFSFLYIEKPVLKYMKKFS
jgi:exopolysaccharide production protein ExoZ